MKFILWTLVWLGLNEIGKIPDNAPWAILHELENLKQQLRTKYL